MTREGIAIASVRDTVWDIVLELAAKDFEVSVDVIQRRADKDGLRERTLPS